MTFGPNDVPKQNQFHVVKPDGTPGPRWSAKYPGYKFSGGDCWATATTEAIAFATKNKVILDPPTTRKKSGNLTRLAGWIDPDIYTAAGAAGLISLRADPKSREPAYRQPSAIAWLRLKTKFDRENTCWVVATDYGSFGEYKAPAGVGFDGNHSIVIFGGTIQGDTILGSDPLADKRRRYPLEVIRRAAQKVGRGENLLAGYCYATEFRQALPPLPPPPPPPPPPPDPETPEQAVIRLTGERDKALADLAAAIAALDIAQTAQALAEAATEDAQARIDAALAALAP